jgi:hypothetical protein
MINQKAVDQINENSNQKKTSDTETLVQIAPKCRLSTISDDEIVSLEGSDLVINDFVEQFGHVNL